MLQKKILFLIEPKRGAKTLPGSRENVWGVINSPSHNEAIAEGRTTTDENRKKEIKKNLAGGLLHAKKIKDGSEAIRAKAHENAAHYLEYKTWYK